jgi:lysophospholipase L1-like esterase
MNDAKPRPRERLRRFVRDAAISTAVAVGLFAVVEIALRVAAPQTSRTEVLSGKSRAIKDPVLGHRYRPGARARHRTPEFDAEYVINSHGRRDSTPPGNDSLAVQVLVVGDSFTFGAGNAEPDVWTAVMGRTLTARGFRVEVVNAGVEGYDTHSEALYLEELVPELHPDVVVLGFLANDVYTNTPAETPPAEADHPGGGVQLHAVEWARRMVMQNDRAYARMFLLTSRKTYYATPASEHVRRQIESTREWLTRMEAYCRARGIRLAAVSIPQQFAVIAGARAMQFRGVDPGVIDRELSQLAGEQGFPWFEMLPPLVEAYRSSGVDMFYRVDGHLTPAGNRVVGEAAADALGPIVGPGGARSHDAAVAR